MTDPNQASFEREIKLELQVQTLTQALAQAQADTYRAVAVSTRATAFLHGNDKWRERKALTEMAEWCDEQATKEPLAVPAAGGGGYDDMFPVSFMKTEHGYQLLDRHNDLLATFEMSRDDHECQKVVDAINAAAPAPTRGMGGKG